MQEDRTDLKSFGLGPLSVKIVCTVTLIFTRMSAIDLEQEYFKSFLISTACESTRDRSTVQPAYGAVVTRCITKQHLLLH